MMKSPKKHVLAALLFGAILVSLSGCAYFNSFYLAQKNFNDAERERERNAELSSEAKNKYNDAIAWSGDVFQNYRDSRYVDDSLYIIAMSYYHLGEFVRARTVFDKLLDTFPESEFVPRAQLYKARSLIGLDQFEEARLILTDLLENEDRGIRGKAGLALADISLLNEEWEDLLNAAETLVETDPDDAEYKAAQIYRARALNHLERYDETIDVLGQLMDEELEPARRFTANSLYAEACAHEGRFDEAVDVLTILQNRGDFVPFEPRIRLELGKIQELSGDDEKALDIYDKLAGDFPDSLASREAYYRIGTIHMEDLSNAERARDAFRQVSEGNFRTEEQWYLQSQLTADNIDSLLARRERITELEDTPDLRAKARFSLAELLTYSFDRPDSAQTQYRLILEEAPESDFAVMSEFFIARYEARQDGRLTETVEEELMRDIIGKYPESEFAGRLRVHLGIIRTPPAVQAFERAEQARMSGAEPEEYLPLYRAVADSFPGTESAYKARFAEAYYIEHHAGELGEALSIYKELASEEPNLVNSTYVDRAREKLSFYASESERLEEIRRYLAGYVVEHESVETASPVAGAVEGDATDANEPYSGMRKIRARNERIRSRYFTD